MPPPHCRRQHRAADTVAALFAAASAAEAHSATASAVGGTQTLRRFTSTVRKCADARTFGRPEAPT
jgi:hypothetical protein